MLVSAVSRFVRSSPFLQVGPSIFLQTLIFEGVGVSPAPMMISAHRSGGVLEELYLQGYVMLFLKDIMFSRKNCDIKISIFDFFESCHMYHFIKEQS